MRMTKCNQGGKLMKACLATFCAAAMMDECVAADAGLALKGGADKARLALKTAKFFAHRGGRNEFEENTMGAFKASHAAGVRGYETDVHLTKDGEIVICHDSKIDRTYNGSGVIKDMTLAELRVFRSKKNGEKIPTLDEFVAFLADKNGFYVEFEMKGCPDGREKEYVGKLYETAMARKPGDSVYVFTSFNEKYLKAMSEFNPGADRMLIVGQGLSDAVIARAQALGIKRVGCVKGATTRDMVRKAKKAGMVITGWPGSNVSDYVLAVGLEFDAICTDVPVAVIQFREGLL